MAMDAVTNMAADRKEPLGAEKFIDPTTFCARARMADDGSAMNAAVEWCDKSGEHSRTIFDNMLEQVSRPLYIRPRTC